MRLTDKQIDRIADSLLSALLKEGGATLKSQRGEVIARIGGVIRENLKREEALDREARTLLEAHLKNAGGDVDEHKLLVMIKKKLAEEKDFPL
ncbi:MAG: DUF507 family protein [Desulfuromonadales bacterium]|nr:DUF507 family protein [Desulfuromonadales bacterium]NIS41088.1 DUF507 family protein [Desulfuromonadales bacterium]